MTTLLTDRQPREVEYHRKRAEQFRETAIGAFTQWVR